MSPSRTFVAAGGVLGFLSVAIGAFGAHALKSTLEARGYKGVFETGVQYQMAHSLALLLLACLCDSIIPARKLVPIAYLFVFGIVVFSGSLYMLAITGITVLGAITPFGGLSLLSAWALLVAAAVRTDRGSNT